MPGMNRLLRRRNLIGTAAALAALGLAAVGPAGAGASGHISGTAVKLASTTHAIPSTQFWAGKAGEMLTERQQSAALDSSYQGNTDDVFLAMVKKAAALGHTGHSWRNVGPTGGVVDVNGTGSGAELFGPVDGIGTAMAVDKSDSTGNTVYLGTIGGLYKTTDGGKTVHNIGDSFARASIGAIAVDPSNHDDVYAGTGVSIFTLSYDAAGTGVYVSHDAGQTWTRPSLNIHGYGVNAIDVLPDGTVLVGTTYGLWRSTNHGASFTKVTVPDHVTKPLGHWVTAVVHNPTNASEVTIAVGFAFGKKQYADGIIGAGNGLYRSTNGGATFTFMASTSQLTNQAASSDPFGRTALAYSPDGHVLWALVSDAGRTAGNHIDIPVVGLPIDGNTELNGLYRSNDDGANWGFKANTQTLLTALGGTLVPEYPLGYAPGVQASYNLWVLPAPNDDNRVYIGLEEAYTGEDQDPTNAASGLPAMTWTGVEKYANLCGFFEYGSLSNNGSPCPGEIPEYGSGTTHPDQHSAVIATTASGFRLYSGNDGGWWSQDAHSVTDSTGASYQGVDNGTWTSLGKPPTVLPWDVTPLQDGSYLLALQDNGMAHVRPDGTAYQVCGGDGVYVYPGANASSYYCGIDGQTILGTTDDFKTTVFVGPGGTGMGVSTGATFLSPWSVDASDSNHLIAAAGNIDETTAGLNSDTFDPSNSVLLSTKWVDVFDPPTSPNGAWDSSATFTSGPVAYVAMCDKCRPSIASGTVATPTVVVPKIVTNVKTGCAPTKATSACWHMAASNGLPHQQVSDIAVDPNNDKTVYVGLRNFIVMGTDNTVTGTQKVMVSHDGGDTFTDLTGDLPIADVHRIALRDGMLYVATDVGVFVSKAGTKAWKQFGTGLPQVTYRSMRLSLDGRYLLAGAYGRGGWVYDFNAKAAVPPTVPVKVPLIAAGGGLAKSGMSGRVPVVALMLLLAAAAAYGARRRLNR
jgi:hypothetical protein